MDSDDGAGTNTGFAGAVDSKSPKSSKTGWLEESDELSRDEGGAAVKESKSPKSASIELD